MLVKPSQCPIAPRRSGVIFGSLFFCAAEFKSVIGGFFFRSVSCFPLSGPPQIDDFATHLTLHTGDPLPQCPDRFLVNHQLIRPQPFPADPLHSLRLCHSAQAVQHS